MRTVHNALDTRLLALTSMHCREGAPSLGADELAAHVAALDGWLSSGGRIEKTFSFANYTETMAFVNALAWIAITKTTIPNCRSITTAAWSCSRPTAQEASR